MAKQMKWKMRVYRARKQGYYSDKYDKDRAKSRLIVKLRGWKHVFKLKKLRLPDVRKQKLLSPEDRLDCIRSQRAGRRFWYTLSYMMGSGGWHRKFVARIRLFGNRTGKPKKNYNRFVSQRHKNRK